LWSISVIAGLVIIVAAVGVALSLPLRRLVENTAATSTQKIAVENPTFGQVIEKIIHNSDEHAGFQGLDFDSGRMWTAAAAEIPHDDQPKSWITEHGIDLLAVGKGGSKWVLGTLQGKIAPLPEAQWTTESAVELRRALASTTMEESEGMRYCQIRFDGKNPSTFALQTGSGLIGLLQVTGVTENPRGLAIRYKLVHGPTAEKAQPDGRADRIAVEDLALHMIVAIREKDDAKLKSLASDRIKGWPDALPVFAVELREHYRQMTGDEKFDMRAVDSLVDGELAAVRCTGPEKLKDVCLILFFVKTKDGWRNHSLRNAATTTPLAKHLAEFKVEFQK
jgi:hypothetical protein